MTDPMTITRHFATVSQGRFGARQVHYRRAGRGPCLFLFHQSPMSSRDLLPVIERWKHAYTCIAPDTPGYGLSDPFDVGTVELDDVADAVIEFADAIGVGRFAAYGFHTGAMIAVATAAKFPDRVACTVANGYVVSTEAMRADLLAHYLPKFEPKWDGSHLTWLWARLREQTVFFPWYRPELGNRMSFDMPPPEALQNGVVEFLRAGDNYRVGYRAAFSFRSDVAIERAQVPVLVTANSFDPLYADLARIGRRGPEVEVQGGGAPEETLALCDAFLARHVAPEPPPAPAVAPLPGRMWQQWVDLPGGQVRVRRNTDAPGRTVVVQHDAAGSSDTVALLSQSFIGRRPVLAIDLPGHGESDNTFGTEDVTVEHYAGAVRQVLEALGLSEVDFHGVWGGGLVGLQLALDEPARVRHLSMSDILWFDDALIAELEANYTPAIVPNWYGGHLLMCWHLMRDQGLFWPWYRRNKDGIIWRRPYLDPTMIQGRVTEMFKAPEMWRRAYQAHFSYRIKERLPRVKVPTLLSSPEWDPQFPHTAEAARANPHCGYLVLPDSPADWGRALMPFLES